LERANLGKRSRRDKANAPIFFLSELATHQINHQITTIRHKPDFRLRDESKKPV
jgi:hypothetical protein